MKNLLLALALTALVACGNDKSVAEANEDVLMSSNIDSLAGWISDPNAITKGEAHSGQYSLRVDQNREFSAGYVQTLGLLSPTRIRGIRLAVWAYVPNKDATAKIEFMIKDASGKLLLLDQTKLEEVKKYGEWVEINKVIMLPPETNYSSQINMHMSRSGATSPVYLDDIKLSAIR
ncbi:MAG: hypothetical protein ACRYFV_05345 [Janthinobacterium lividum]